MNVKKVLNVRDERVRSNSDQVCTLIVILVLMMIIVAVALVGTNLSAVFQGLVAVLAV